MDDKDKMEHFLDSGPEAIEANKEALAKILRNIQVLKEKSDRGENVAQELKYQMALIKKIKEDQERLARGGK